MLRFDDDGALHRRLQNLEIRLAELRSASRQEFQTRFETESTTSETPKIQELVLFDPVSLPGSHDENTSQCKQVPKHSELRPGFEYSRSTLDARRMNKVGDCLPHLRTRSTGDIGEVSAMSKTEETLSQALTRLQSSEFVGDAQMALAESASVELPYLMRHASTRSARGRSRRTAYTAIPNPPVCASAAAENPALNLEPAGPASNGDDAWDHVNQEHACHAPPAAAAKSAASAMETVPCTDVHRASIVQRAMGVVLKEFDAFVCKFMALEGET